MKELSVEEKAKAYDKAIKVAADIKAGIATYITDRTPVIDAIFPELADSEDEKIRKALLKTFRNFDPNGTFWTETLQIDKERVVAWLEKQSTPQVRTGLEWVNTIDDACDKRYAEEYAHGEYCHEQSFKWGFQEGVDWLEKQGEQKPADKKGMNLVEEEMTPFQKEVFCIIDTTIEEEQGLKQVCDKLFALASNEIKQKSSWSEKDKEMSRLIGNAITADEASAYLKSKGIEVTDAHVWLEEIKGRVQPQQKWSEEDSRILYNVKAYIGYAAGQRGVKDELFKEANEWLNSLPIGFIYNKNYNEDMVTLLVGELKQIANDNNAPEQYQVEINWLKSLRPQSTWKPSESDIRILEKVIDGTANPINYHATLHAILEKLKKLREE